MNRLRAIWHIVLGDSVMYRVTASRQDHIAGQYFWGRGFLRTILPPSVSFVVIECDTWEARDEDWKAGISGQSGRQSSHARQPVD